MSDESTRANSARLARLIASDDAAVLRRDQQRAYLALLARGSSTVAACLTLDVSVSAVVATMQSDLRFASELQQVKGLLSQNVATALYRKAMEGSVTAQSFLLKNLPPPDWQAAANPVSLPDDLTKLNEEELHELVCATLEAAR